MKRESGVRVCVSHMSCVFMQYIVESARQRPAKRRVSSSGRKSLYQKLYELYMEECEKEPELKVTLTHQVHLKTSHIAVQK